MKQHLVALAAASALLALIPSTSNADTFAATGAKATTFYANDDRAVIHSIDESGLNGSGQHTNLYGGLVYLSNAEPSPTITFDFGKSFTLSGLHLWNYNEITSSGNDFTTRGIQSATLLISNDKTFATSTNLGTQTFTKASGLTDYTGLDYSISAGTGRYLRFTNVVKFGDPASDPYTGISEIKFQGTLTPISLITPSSADASSFYNGDDRAPGHTIDNSGITDAVGEHSNSPGGKMWLAEKLDASKSITWNLGSKQAFTGIRLWNYNENSGNPAALLKRGIQTAHVEVADDAGFSQNLTDLGTMTFDQATGLISYSGVDYPIAATSGQYVRFSNLTDFGGDGYIGLSEVRFIAAVPEPAAIGLLLLAGAGLLRRRV